MKKHETRVCYVCGKEVTQDGAYHCRPTDFFAGWITVAQGYVCGYNCLREHNLRINEKWSEENNE